MLGSNGRRGTVIAASAAVLCLGGVLAACGGGTADEGYVALGAAGTDPGRAPAGAQAPSGKVTLVPLDRGGEEPDPGRGGGGGRSGGREPAPGASGRAHGSGATDPASGGTSRPPGRPDANGTGGTDGSHSGGSGGGTGSAGGPGGGSTGSTGPTAPSVPGSPAPGGPAELTVGAPCGRRRTSAGARR